MLLDPNVEENVGFIVVVGIGGLGKTALARLVYNHDRVGTRFEKKLWTCVSDQDGKGLDVQAILGDIIESSTNKKPSDVSTMESMQTKLQEELKNKVYLLVLDDVWTEDPNEWSKLSKYLTVGGRGSRVVITTRSEKTAEVVLGKATHSKKYMLQSLSDENSWHLFALTAFERESDEANDPELMTIGKKIVKKCSNVPLAIKVLGTLLYGQTHKWESFEKNRILHIETIKNPIMSILKLSYNNLEPPVKNCFRYCALFPKDFEMYKHVERDDLGDIVSLKMHDLMHYLAQEVGGDEIIVSNSPPNNLRRKPRHLFIDAKEVAISYVHERLTCMPLGIDQLTNLQDLTYYNVRKVSPIRKQFGGQLKDLKFLVNLRGRLEIRTCGILVSENENKWEGGYLEHIKNLKVICIYFNKEARESNNEALIERLQPNRNLMELSLDNYNGSEIPRWGRAHDDWSIILPKLVNIQLDNFKRIHGIPLLSNLKHLKFLTLSRLSNLEYMEHGAISHGCSRSKEVSFFPSLVYLRIDGLKRLKGWWGGVCEGDSSSCMPHWQPPFPRLSKLAIEECPELTSLPPCPTLESLHLTRSSKSLRILPGQGPANLDLKLKVYVDSVGYLTTLPARCLADIVRQNDGIPVVDEEFEDDMLWRSLSHNLRSLELKGLDALKMLPRGMKHLTALEKLSIDDCKGLKGLPEWIGCLSSLQFLTIERCKNIKSLGGIQSITSLQELVIYGCVYLQERCDEPRGKEWPNIQHIPHLYLTSSPVERNYSTRRKPFVYQGFVMNMQQSGAEADVDIRVLLTADQAALEQRIADE
ncbi:putative disease resistance protein RGA4 [Silene latifolia]|uniref:putative disease resistance protein RGA4 n=1 Tax=Silene latifolia TaxID=37657 RepID=UPI003D7821AD